MDLLSAAHWNELEPSLLILVGFVLFVFPEPVTSALGSGLLLLGAAWWFYEWGRREPTIPGGE